MNWTCPYCNRPQTATSAQYASGSLRLNVEAANEFGEEWGLGARAFACANVDCKRVSLTAWVGQALFGARLGWSVPLTAGVFHSFALLPESAAKPQPSYIPAPLVEDYIEACRIRDLSPKASATFSRRCLQGMIRDFATITKRTLYDEIEELKRMAEAGSAPQGVSLDSIASLHDVRDLGNIGAHMENDINLIVPVEPDEAQILISLIETLFEEWYVARHTRQEKFALLRKTVAAKQAIKASGKADDGGE